jgi:hypothetical protein
MTFNPKESYKHLIAKQLLAKWLRDEDYNNEYCNVAQFHWKSNYGVYEELKFFETSQVHYFENSKGIIPDIKKENYYDLFDPNIDRGKILFVPDITVFQNEYPTYLFEVVHTNPVSHLKRFNMSLFFRNHPVEVFEIKAEDILREDSMSIPDYLPTNRIL